MKHLVVGLGASGEAIARALLDRGESVVVVEDRPSSVSRQRAGALGGVEVHEAPTEDELAALVGESDVAVPSPGVPARHPVWALARQRDVPILGEVELASRWTDTPLVAITGTNGKTTVTTLVRDMLVASGLNAIAAGNIGLPLVDAVTRAADVYVVEVSSFQLDATETFRPRVAVWLNLAEDHLEAHPSFEAYAAAKARIWRNQAGDDVAIGNADDPVVAAALADAPARRATFGLVSPAAEWRIENEQLRAPDGTVLAAVAELDRALPHDLANALASSAAALAGGGTVEGVHEALVAFRTLPHRLTLVGEAGGVRWFDDSKATNPHAALAAIASFESVVLVAGGRNKGLDLSVLAGAGDRVRAVVAIGEAAGEVEAAFAGRVPVSRAESMPDAVTAAAELARDGDVVLLSPGCASFDWYGSYAERGDDFAASVRAHLEAR